MYTPHQSVHQFSPQRRRIGTAKREGQKQPFLGDEEASHIGPEKLFSDLKNTSGKKAGSSSVFSKPPSRALGEKNSQSPQRRNGGVEKPSMGKGKSTASGSVLHASPSKTNRSRSTSPAKGSLKFSPVKQSSCARPPPILLSPLVLEEGTSYHTTVSPTPGLPKTPVGESIDKRLGFDRPSSFVTPASNIGEAGAIRLRRGEMFDALNQVQEETVEESAQTESQIEATEVAEAYPEIEYMPPPVEVPYDFPPALDDLPRAKEMGEIMANMSMIGFYKPSSEESKQAMLAEVFKYRPDPCQTPETEAIRKEESNEPWPDIEVKITPKVDARRPISSPNPTISKPKVVRKFPASNMSSATQLSRSNGDTASKGKGSALKPKILGVRDTNAGTKRVINPALRDFENDHMGKIVQAKLRAIDSDQPEGFIL